MGEMRRLRRVWNRGLGGSNLNFFSLEPVYYLGDFQ